MILVVGASGELGGRVAELLRSAGHEVRCLVRLNSDEARLREIGAEVVHGDLTVPASLKAACQDTDTVIATATAITRRLAGTSPATIQAVDEEGMSSLVDAAEAAGVRRFVYISFTGADAAIGTPLARAKLATERRLAISSLQPVVVRSDAFQEVQFSPMARFDMAAGKITVIGKGNTKRRWVAAADVAALIAAVATEPNPPLMIEFGGPEPLTKNEAIAIATELTHHRMKVQRIPRSVARLAVRLLDRRNDALSSVFGAGLHQDLHEATWDDKPLRERGINARTVSEYLREQAHDLI
ncbi:SDR family oxidoreductase [Arthrobacter sp. ISL-69]|uniref:SDR family oxidoreductase n=1 Tax=Arthrobacter sp. ISL-69 TaxID=2819113 RepID=UPI001BECFF12|nr:NAD(P)H-binding protein [Arthrobacter sp. ISL-69]MBT2538730.1 NmrA family NAD(P)-binding protein [Arthrobacter sp. ISL-69]